MLRIWKKLHRRNRIAIGLAGITATLFPFLYRPQWLANLLHQNSDRDVHYRIPTQLPNIALTIDDGPNADTTPQILEILKEHGAHATFFIIGEQVKGNEGILENLVDNGHELGNHLWRDTRSILLQPEQFKQQLTQTHDVLQEFGPVRWFRPGSGWYNQRMLRQVRQLDYEVVLGSVYPYDAHQGSVPFISRYIRDNAAPGAIIILHDGSKGRGATTAQVLRDVLPALQQAGFQIVSLSEMVAGAR
jgi:peptidoglycan/xylan/chitin deacetylase (PgdA/CDA1 family)